MQAYSRKTTLSSGIRRILAAAAVIGAVAAIGCGPEIAVRTTSEPNANLAQRHTFRILPTPQVKGVSLSADDPMLDNSEANRAIRQDIRQAFESRGYVESNNPDFTIAYYATTRPKLDIQQWNYGYTWRGWPREYTEVNQYEQGTVIIDAVDPAGKDLLWRGRGIAAVSTNPNGYLAELSKTVSKIVSKYPESVRASHP